jgi:chorismate mutase/GNAT superfamily N-acetyltransferase
MDDLQLRPAGPGDLPALAGLFLRARAAAVPAMPPAIHSEAEVRAWVGGWDLEAWDVWLAEGDGRPKGFAVVTGDWLHSLYVAPDAAGQGVGGTLLDLVKGLRPDGFCLWVFESNVAAREFYENRGLVSLERTDGSANEERAPDIRMAWPGSDPLAFFRRLIDEVDEQLGDLLARRAALTRAVQPLKPDGSRDPVRERRIAEAMAARAPALGTDRLARIVDAIVTESLDAAASMGGDAAASMGGDAAASMGGDAAASSGGDAAASTGGD